MRGSQKLVEDGRQEVEQKEIIRAKIVDKEVPCKGCKKKPRAQASKHCSGCSHERKMRIINDGRLKEKINKQIFKK